MLPDKPVQSFANCLVAFSRKVTVNRASDLSAASSGHQRVRLSVEKFSCETTRVH